MDSAPLPAPPTKNFLQWVMANPQEVEAYLRRVVALSHLEIVVRRPNGITRVPVEFSRSNSVASLPPIELEAAADTPSGPVTGGGDVFGPAASTPDNIPQFFDSTGKRIKDSGVSILQIDPRGLHSLWIPAVVMKPAASGGCAALATVATAGVIDTTSLDFDKTTAENAQFWMALPDTWDLLGTIYALIYWSHGSGATAFGVTWKLRALFLADASSIFTAPSAAVLINDSGGTAEKLYITDATPVVDPAGTEARGGVIAFNLQRDPADAGDTLDVDAKLLGVRLFFRTSYPNENPLYVPPPPLHAETIAWRDYAISFGGTFLSTSIIRANNLIVALNATAYNSKILYMLPFLGGNLATARVPLRRLGGLGGSGAAIATNNNFVEADFSEATGLQANGTTKYLDTAITTNMLRPGTDFGGMGFWERNQQSDGQNACGARATQLWRIYYDTSTPRTLFNWPSGNPPTYGASGNNHIYLQSFNAALCTGYVNGALVSTQTTNTGSSTGSPNFMVCAVDASFLGKVRAGVFYLTDGTMTDAEIAAFHSLLQTYLITATGR